MMIVNGENYKLDWMIDFQGTGPTRAKKIASLSSSIGRNDSGVVFSPDKWCPLTMDHELVSLTVAAVEQSANLTDRGPRRMRDTTLLLMGEWLEAYDQFILLDPSLATKEQVLSSGGFPRTTVEGVSAEVEDGCLTVRVAVDTLAEAEEVVALALKEGLASSGIIIDPRVLNRSFLDWSSAKYLLTILDNSDANQGVLDQLQRLRERLILWTSAPHRTQTDD